MKTAVVIVNTGTPRSAAWYDVGCFLFRFLNDRRVVSLPLVPRLLLVNGIIIPSRLRASAKRYREFFGSGNRSLAQHMRALEQGLNEHLPAGCKAFAAMRYSKPGMKETLEVIRRGGYEKITLIPLFPQYAEATTGSVIDKFTKITSAWSARVETRIVESFYRHPLYIQALADSLQQLDAQQFDHVLFSYHSLPLSHIAREKGTPRCYQTACETTTQLLAQHLQLGDERYATCYQSRMSPHRWLGPFTNDVLQNLAREGKKNVLLISPGLVTDCLETTHELGVESAQLFYEHGGTRLTVAPGLNSGRAWIQALRALALTGHSS